MSAQILTLSVGKITPLVNQRETVPSAIRKTPISTLDEPRAVRVQTLGLEGDEQADRRVHGGPHQALYFYPAEHYPVWQTLRMQALKVEESLPYGFMGENVTVRGLLETDVWVGDQLHIGEGEGGVILVISRPRAPCFKFNIRMGFKHAAKMMVQSAYTGWYTAVLREGTIKAGDPVRVEPGERVVRIDEKHRLDTSGGQDPLL